MKWIFCIFLLISIEAKAIEKDQIGESPLAIAHPKFNCSSFLNSIKHQKTINIAWLYTTFGKSYECLNKILHDSRLKYIETHLLNEPGHRNKRLENNEFLKKYTVAQWNHLLLRENERLKQRFIRYNIPLQKILEKRAETSICLVSPGLESNISYKAGKILIEWTREIFPSCLIVWNPIKPTISAKVTNADFIEQHSTNPKVAIPCLVNLDGTDISFPTRISPNKKFYRTGRKNWIESSDLKKFLEKYKKCDVVFLWVSEYNCIDIDRKSVV